MQARLSPTTPTCAPRSASRPREGPLRGLGAPGRRRPRRAGCRRLEGGRIAAVGPASELSEGERFTDSVIVPGLVNAHTHLEYAVYSGFGDGQPFGPWPGHTSSVRHVSARRSASQSHVSERPSVWVRSHNDRRREFQRHGGGRCFGARSSRNRRDRGFRCRGRAGRRHSKAHRRAGAGSRPPYSSRGLPTRALFGLDGALSSRLRARSPGGHTPGRVR